MFDPYDDHRSSHLRYLAVLAWTELWFTIVPGFICSSPLLLVWLAEAISFPALGFLALIMVIPALIVSLFFLPTVGLLSMLIDYDPATLKGGSLMPLPAHSLADWGLLLGAHGAVIAAVLTACFIVALRRG